MGEEELRDALGGLFAYDTGSIDSGIHDEVLRERCKEIIMAMPVGEYELMPRLWLSRLVRDRYLSEEALAQGYGIEDVFSFVRWLHDEMDMPEL